MIDTGTSERPRQAWFSGDARQGLDLWRQAVIQQLTAARGVMGIYAIVLTKTGQAYIGSSSNIGGRLICHRSALRRGVHKTARLQQAWNEHGEAAFAYALIERVASVADLAARESVWLDESETFIPGIGYNRSPSPTGAGWQYTAEQRERLSSALTGKPKSAEHRASLNRKVVSAESREAMRLNGRAVGLSGRGVPKSAEHRRKIGAAQRGDTNHRARLTEAQVIEIKRRLAAGGETLFAIGRDFGVHEVTIHNIKSGKRWGHVRLDG